MFWAGEERPTLIDVAVGLVDAGSGVRAEDWLERERTDRVSFKGDAHDQGLVDALEDGLKKLTLESAAVRCLPLPVW